MLQAVIKERRGFEKPRFLRRLLRHDLKSLMALYEENFDLFFRLAPEVRSLPCQQDLVAEGEFPLFLTIVEENPYTTTLILTHRFRQLSGHEEEPSARIRLYHDSQQGEVLSMNRGESLLTFLSLVDEGMENLDARWRLNLFLNHWLRHCLERGYQFTQDSQKEE